MRKQTALCVLTQRMIVRSGSESYPVSVHTRAKTVIQLTLSQKRP